MKTFTGLVLGLLSLALLTAHPVGAPIRDALHATPLSGAATAIEELPAKIMDTGGTGHAFTRETEAGPLRWRTCETVPVLVNADDEFTAEIEAGLAQIRTHTGIDLRIVGTTELVPDNDWALTGPALDGASYRPVIIAVATHEETDMLRRRDSGGAVANPAAVNGIPQYVTGAVVFNADELADHYTPGFGPGRSRGNLVLHELGHLVGLGHVRTNDVMNHHLTDASPDGFTQGDLDGLAAVATGC